MRAGTARRAGGVRWAALALAGCIAMVACGDTVVARDDASPRARPTSTVATSTVTSSAVADVAAPASAGGTALRPIDGTVWRTAVSRLDGVITDTGRPLSGDLGPWVVVRGAASGYLDDRNAWAADLSGDGVNEVVLPLRPAAGQPASGVLVVAASRTDPVVVGDVAFYRSFGFDTRASAENGELVLRHRVGAGWEPPCCWSGSVVRRLRVAGTAVQEVGSPLETGEPIAQGFTVDRFYRLIGARQLDSAYTMLTASERKRMQASQWPALFAGADEVSVTIGGPARTDGMVAFRLVVRSGTQYASWLGGSGFVYDPPTHAWLISLLSLQPES